MTCDFCKRRLTNDDILNGGYDDREVKIHICTECYSKVKELILSGECDVVVENRAYELTKDYD